MKRYRTTATSTSNQMMKSFVSWIIAKGYAVTLETDRNGWYILVTDYPMDTTGYKFFVV